MDKEYTYFITDLSPPMGESHGGRSISDFEYGCQYLYNVIGQKIVRGKKTDQVAVVATHHPMTNNQLDSNNINVVSKMQVPSYEMLRTLQNELQVDEDPVDEEEGDLIKALLVSFAMALDQLKGGKKGIVNFVVITNNKTTVNIEDDDENAIGENFQQILSCCNNGRIFVINIEGGAEKQENDTFWSNLFKFLNNGSRIEPMEQALKIVTAISHGIPKLVRPVKVFDGELRIGCDLNLIDEINFGSKSYEEYNQRRDPISVCITVEGYPFIKKDSTISAKTFSVADATDKKLTADNLHQIRVIKDYQVEDRDARRAAKEEKKGSSKTEEVEDEIIPMKSVSLDETMNVFKYGASTLPLNEAISKISKLRTYEGIDFRGIMKLKDLPMCYPTDESIMILNKGLGGRFDRDSTAFNCFVQALQNLESVAIVRYVLKRGGEVNMGALIPLKIESSKWKGRQRKRAHEEEDTQEEEEAFCFSLVRLPFKEDEKITGFNVLSRMIDEDNDVDQKFAEFLPTHEMVDDMSEYVDMMDLDAGKQSTKDEQNLLIANEYEFNLPISKVPHVEETVSMKLRQPGPANYVLENILRKILIQFSGKENESTSLCDSILQNSKTVDSIISEFYDKFKVPVGEFGLVEDDDRTELMAKLQPIIEELRAKLENEYREPNAGRRTRANDDEVAANGEGDEVDDFDIDALLATGRR